MRFNDIVLGDASVTGITDTEQNGIVRLSGANERLLAQAINNYNSPKTVYGNQIDNDNAKAILGTTGYNYMYTDSDGFIKPTAFTSNDIILGGPTVTGILDSELSGAIIRLCGAGKIETANLVRNYSTAKNVFGMSIDIQNARRYLGTIEYNYIEIDQTGFIKPSSFSCNDIILGSAQLTNISKDDAEHNGAKRYFGTDRYDTTKIIRELAGTKYVIGAEPDYKNAQSILGTTGGYDYQNTTENSSIPFPLTSKMIVLGGPTVTDIADKQLNGAIRLWGDNTALTAQAINNYNSPKYVYGAQVDIDNAKKILRGAGHTYVVVSNVNSNTTFSYNDIVLGGPGPTGITDDQLKGAMRIFGPNSVETASAIQNYYKSQNVYGAKVDIDNASKILKGIVYNYIDTDFIDLNLAESPILPTFTCNDIILGESATKVTNRGLLNGATRLTGSNATETLKLVSEYFKVPIVTPGTGGGPIENFRNDTSLGLSQSQKETMTTVLSALLDEGYEPAFVAGVLGNILAEGTAGYFESSAYISNPSAEPAYLKYMDEHYNYRQDFSGKNISEVGVAKTYNLLQQIRTDGVANIATFGLGAIQWTWDRTMSLINCYIAVCGQDGYPTAEQCLQAENAMVVKELDGNHHNVYTNWLSQYKNTDNAAYYAGSIVCYQYEIPADTYNQAIARGNNSTNIYKVMMAL